MNTIRHACAKGKIDVVKMCLDLDREHGEGQDLDLYCASQLIKNAKNEDLKSFFNYYGEHYDLWKIMNSFANSRDYQVIPFLKKFISLDLFKLKYGKCNFEMYWNNRYNDPKPIKSGRNTIGFSLVMQAYESQLVPYLQELFDQAIQNTDPWTIELLLTYTKDKSIYKLNEKDDEGFTPLMIVCNNDCTDDDNFERYEYWAINADQPSCRIAMVVNELLKCKEMDPNLQNDCGFSAFMLACQNNNYAVKALVKDTRVDINLHDHYGNNGLMVACAQGRSCAIWYIFDAFKNDRHKEPLQTALEHKNMFGQNAYILCCIHNQKEGFENIGSHEHEMDFEIDNEEAFYAMCTCTEDSKIFDELFETAKLRRNEFKIRLSQAFIVTCKSDSLNIPIANKLLRELKQRGQGPTRYQKKVYLKMIERFWKCIPERYLKDVSDKIKAKPFNYRRFLEGKHRYLQRNGENIFDLPNEIEENFGNYHKKKLKKELKRSLTLSISIGRFLNWDNQKNAQKYFDKSTNEIKHCKKLIRENIKIKQQIGKSKKPKRNTLSYLAFRKVQKLDKRYKLILKRETFKQSLLKKMIEKYGKMAQRDRMRSYTTKREISEDEDTDEVEDEADEAEDEAEEEEGDEMFPNGADPA